MSDLLQGTLGEFVSQISGGGTPVRDIPEHWCGDIPWVSVKDLTSTNPESTAEKISEHALASSASRLIPAGIPIVATRMAVGRTTAFSSDVAINQDLKAIFPNEEILNREYLFHFLKANENTLASKGTGSTVKGIRLEDLEQLPIAVPPLPEQKKIAEILSGIDEQIKRTRCQIAYFKKLGNAITKNLLGSLQDELMPLSEVSINHDSRRVPIKSDERATRKGPYRYYGASGVIDTIDDFRFDGNYILIGEDGANIINRNKPLAFRVSGRFWVNNHAHIIQPREFCDINFLTCYLESLDYAGIASGSAQPKITRSALDSILIPVPTMETQKKIGSAIESTISAASNAERKENKLLDLKQALASDLLSGRKRVSV